MLHFLRLFALSLVLLFTGHAAHAQLIPGTSTSAAEDDLAIDPLGRTTPRGTIYGFIEAMAAKDPDRGANYLQIEGTAFQKRTKANALRLVLDRNGTLNQTVDINNTPDGDISDGLDVDIDVVGTLGSGADETPLKLRRLVNDGTLIWLISAETLDAVPGLLRNSDISIVEQWTPEAWENAYFLGVSAGNWIALLFLFGVAVIAGYIVAFVLIWVASAVWLKTGVERTANDIGYARLPLGLLLSNIWFKAGAVSIGVSVVAREYAFRLIDIGSVIAIIWLVFVVTRAAGQLVLRQMSRRSQTSAISVAKLLTRIVNAVALLIGVVLILDILGFDVTTGLAALGIGGIALALGAQKTIENLVGSVMLVVDQPIRVGDFCQFEGALGTVEDIGIRSTRVRTLERTLVTIPNGSFSSMQIENYTLREKYLFRHQLGARYETNTKAIRIVKNAIFEYLAAHPQIEGDEPGVRFIALGSDNLTIEVFAYIIAKDVPEFYEIQGDILLALIEIFEQEGVEFAFPSQTVYLARDSGVPIVPKPSGAAEN